jgi:hypothetical protein
MLRSPKVRISATLALLSLGGIAIAANDWPVTATQESGR